MIGPYLEQRLRDEEERAELARRLAVAEEAARATHPHAVEVDDDGEDDGAWIVRFTCSAPADAECRSWCAEGCEESCTSTPILGPVEEVAQAPLDGHRWVPMVPPACRVVDWLGAGDAADREELHAEDEPLRPGVHPIAVEWDGDGYLWTYAVPDPEPLYPGHP